MLGTSGHCWHENGYRLWLEASEHCRSRVPLWWERLILIVSCRPLLGPLIGTANTKWDNASEVLQRIFFRKNRKFCWNSVWQRCINLSRCCSGSHGRVTYCRNIICRIFLNLFYYLDVNMTKVSYSTSSLRLSAFYFIQLSTPLPYRHNLTMLSVPKSNSVYGLRVITHQLCGLYTHWF